MKWQPMMPEALDLLENREALVFAHDGCPFCDTAVEILANFPKAKGLVNRKTRDIIAVIP